jgi:hypothetical protein
VDWPKYLPVLAGNNLAQPLSAGTFAYDYVSEDGYTNMGHWTNLAAKRAGRL